MNQLVNGLSVFFPQRVLSVDDREVSGQYLGSEITSSVVVLCDTDFDKILTAQSESKLSSNSHSNPTVLVFFNLDGNSSVIYDKSKKILFCQSYLMEGRVYVLKSSLSEEFTSEESAKVFEFIKKHTGSVKGVEQSVLANIDGNERVIKSDTGTHVFESGFLSVSLTPLLSFKHNLTMTLSNRCQSLVVLDIASDLICNERFEIQDVKTEQLKEGPEQSDTPKKEGLERYFYNIRA